jgi:hypothetical protein
LPRETEARFLGAELSDEGLEATSRSVAIKDGEPGTMGGVEEGGGESTTGTFRICMTWEALRLPAPEEPQKDVTIRRNVANDGTSSSSVKTNEGRERSELEVPEEMILELFQGWGLRNGSSREGVRTDDNTLAEEATDGGAIWDDAVDAAELGSWEHKGNAEPSSSKNSFREVERYPDTQEAHKKQTPNGAASAQTEICHGDAARSGKADSRFLSPGKGGEREFPWREYDFTTNIALLELLETELDILSLDV